VRKRRDYRTAAAVEREKKGVNRVETVERGVETRVETVEIAESHSRCPTNGAGVFEYCLTVPVTKGGPYKQCQCLRLYVAPPNQSRDGRA
jgi:hypothetical protein